MAALGPSVSKEDETIPPVSGQVDAAMRVVVVSRRARLTGTGDAVVARDLADLLIAIDETHRVTILVDAHDTPIELRFFARLARDFPANVAVIIQGEPTIDRRAFHDQGIYRAQFEPTADGALPEDDALVDRGQLVAKVIAKLERSPTPLIALPRRR
jgi:hypothetical protein